MRSAARGGRRRLARRARGRRGGRSRSGSPARTRWIAIEDVARYRDAVGVQPPAGVPVGVPRPDGRGARGPARPVRPDPRTVPRARAGAPLGPPGRASSRTPSSGCSRPGSLLRGEFRPGGAEREWCDPEVLRQLRRRSLARLRREVEPVEPAALARFLPDWQGVAPLPGRRRTGRGAAAAPRHGRARAARRGRRPAGRAADPGLGPRARRPAGPGPRLPAAAPRRARRARRGRLGRAREPRPRRRPGRPLPARPGGAARRPAVPGSPARPRRRAADRSRVTRRSGHSSPGAAPRSIARSTPRPGAARTARCSTRCGTSSGPARSRTTRSRRSARSAGRARAARPGGGPAG